MSVYRYFVAYAIEGGGFGNCELNWSCPVESIGDTCEMADLIKKHRVGCNVVILTFTPLPDQSERPMS